MERFIRTAKAFYHRFLEIRGTPRQIALGMALGVFISMTPIYGFHTVTGITLASIFGWSKIAAGLGVNVTNPITAPVIYYFLYKLGAKITGFTDPGMFSKLLENGGFMELIKNSPMIFIDLLIGGIIVGIPLSLVVYRVTFLAASKVRAKKSVHPGNPK